MVTLLTVAVEWTAGGKWRGEEGLTGGGARGAVGGGGGGIYAPSRWTGKA